jgi:photosystem II stability/assembly factor-like uncharacterized protein
MYSNNPAAILRSKDQGRTFEIIPVPFKMGGNEDGRGVGERLNVDPANTRILYFGSRYEGLWKSTDSASTWTKVESFPLKKSGTMGNWRLAGKGVSFIVFDPRSASADGAGSRVIYAGVAEKAEGIAALYRSADAGQSWQPVAGLPAGMVAHRGELDSDGTFYITLGSGAGPNGVTDGAVFALNTATNTWTDITPDKPTPDHRFGYAGLSIDRQHAGTLVVTTADRWNPHDEVFRTTDGGKTWKPVGPTQEMDVALSPYLYWGKPKPREGWWMDAVAIDPSDSNHVLYGTGATIYGTHDMTALDFGVTTHWSVEADGIEETADICLLSPPAGAHLISALGDICGFVHDDLTVSPPQGMMNNPINTTTDSLDCAWAQPATLVRVGDKGGSISTDGGKTWTAFTGLGTQGQGRGGAVAISADGKSIVLTHRTGAAQISRDGGKTWDTVASLPAGYRPVADRVNPSKFYAIGNGRVLASDDGGASFHLAAGDLSMDPGAQLFASPAAEGDLWLAAGHQGLWRSTDGGQHFKRINEQLTDAHKLGVGMPAPGRTNPALFLAGEVAGTTGIFRSDDDGQSWLRINDDQHQYGWLPDYISGDPRVFGRVYLGMNGRGVIYGDPRP